jgi:hypothetical protein
MPPLSLRINTAGLATIRPLVLDGRATSPAVWDRGPSGDDCQRSLLTLPVASPVSCIGKPKTADRATYGMEPMLPERFLAPATFAGRYSILVKLRFAQKPIVGPLGFDGLVRPSIRWTRSAASTPVAAPLAPFGHWTM